jgi:hypothetical protein
MLCQDGREPRRRKDSGKETGLSLVICLAGRKSSKDMTRQAINTGYRETRSPKLAPANRTLLRILRLLRCFVVWGTQENAHELIN